MKARSLICNARIHTQADGLVADSMAVSKGRIVAVGANLQHDSEFRSFERIDLKGRTVVPGLVDAHTHFHFFALSLGRVSLHGLDSLDACLRKIKDFSATLKNTEWVVGEGYAPDAFRKRVEPTCTDLDLVTGERPAFLFSKDQHSAWVNSRALDLCGVTSRTADPTGGEIVRFDDGSPSGILREGPAIRLVYDEIPSPSEATAKRRYNQALKIAYERGVTGVHSFDGPDGFALFSELAEKGKLGLRINYYPPAGMLPQLRRSKTRYGAGDDFLRIAGVKLFADGSLGSQTGLCFNKYLGSKNNYGIEVTPPEELSRIVKASVRLGLPCAVHAIGDRAVSNVLDAFETAPPLKSGGRHRIEHLQMIRRKDISRLKRLGVTASMQPSHCPSDIKMVRQYWGARGRNAYIFRTLNDLGIPLAFGSDVPIEPLDPLGGVTAAVRRALPGKRDVFYPEQRLTALEALFGFTAGAAYAVSQETERGFLLPGYPADYVVLSDDIARTSAAHLCDIKPLATALDGKLKYCHNQLRI